MSKFAVISDIHANLEALQTVLAEIDKEEIEDVVCLGDIVGYGADPVACLQVIRERQIICLQGNHDRQMVGEIDENTRDYAVEALLWTRAQLDEDAIEFLIDLPEQFSLGGVFLFCHGSPRERDEYIVHIPGMQANLQHLHANYPEIRVCFFGHTHLPSIIGGDLAVQELTETGSFSLDRLSTYLINPGGVGQPRDKCPKASFVTFDRSSWTLTFHRLEYDIDAARQKILEAELPRKLAERLMFGY